MNNVFGGQHSMSGRGKRFARDHPGADFVCIHVHGDGSVEVLL